MKSAFVDKSNDMIEAERSPIALVRDSSDTSTLPAGCATRKGDLTDLAGDVCEGVDDDALANRIVAMGSIGI